jgi:hypothetical protein
MFEFTSSCKKKGISVCRADAGPAWRAAFDAGIDMEELETTLRLTVEQRLIKHDKLLNEWLQFEAFMEQIYNGWKFIKSYHVNFS